MVTFRRIYNIFRYGVGPAALERKRAVKAAKRQQIFESGTLWQQGDDQLTRRRYDSYRQYLDHQAAKLDEITDRLEETQAEDLAEFQRRFETCTSLQPRSRVLCLGARLGTEVNAFLKLGHFAVGIDLNPGENNQFVLHGDFHHLVFAAGSVDVVYTNVLDHVFDLERAMAEVTRVLTPDGMLLADILPGYEEGFTPGRFEATHWPRLEVLIERIMAVSPLRRESVRDLGHHRRDQWFQVVFRKDEPAQS
jgi:SAM-dependent methyltransferase